MTEEAYFRRLEARLAEAREVAERAREQGHDPETTVEIPQAKDMADRVEKVLGIDGVAARVRELEGEMSREEAALALVEDFVEGTVGDFETRAGTVEGAVRTAVALLTEGVVAAPIEGIDRVEVLENDDGSEFVDVYYAGPIRSAGGTAQALSVLVADYARSLLGLDEYCARGTEVERYAEEVSLYDDDTGLQYSPTDAESKHVARNMPVMLDGEATGNEEVSGYRDLERVDTNNPRGGMCLVLAEGIALKAPKIRRYTRELDEVEWPWLQALIDGTVGEDAADGDDSGGEGEGDADAEDAGGPPRAESSKKYLRDLIAGRPVFGHPSEMGGFRLRYGRARNHGHATAGVHPAAMRLVDDFLAAGTQLKTERPGKAAGVVPVDSIEGPTVRLADGDVRRIDDPEEATAVRNGVEAVLDLGEYLVNYGEFVENNHDLVPASYTPEWWVREFDRTDADVVALRDDSTVDLDRPTVGRALEWAREFDAPLHPEYTYLWHDVDPEDALALARALDDAAVEPAETNGRAPADRLLLHDDRVRETLERLLVEHHQGRRLGLSVWRPLVRSLGFEVDAGSGDGPALSREWRAEDLSAETRDAASATPLVDAVAPFEVRERAPTRVGCRMGRPEKSEKRELSPAVHTLFPLGEAGGNQRDVAAAAEYAPDRRSAPGVVTVDVGRRGCPACGAETYESRCDCGTHTEPRYECPDCGRRVEPDEADRVRCPRCDVTATAVEEREINVGDVYRDALGGVGERASAFDVLKGVKGLTSTIKMPEPVEKGVLRAKHGVSAFKDGTVRYDMTDLPVTAVRPNELGVSPAQLRELGYERDVHGEPLRHGDQLVELKVQDVVLSEGAADHLLSTADFVDDLLAQFYDLAPFYEFEERDDLVGELVFGMAPHTSAAVVGRVVGFTAAAVGYAHPYFHASKRRNCFHPDTKLWYSEDGEWHHERIEDFVEGRLDEDGAETDDFGALVQELDDGTLVTSVDERGLQCLNPVEAVSRHPSRNHLVEVETDDERSLTVTPDHEMLRWTGDDRVERVRAAEIGVGDAVPVPKRSAERYAAAVEETPAVTDGGSTASDTAATSTVTDTRIVEGDGESTYCLTVGDDHTLEIGGMFTAQCDGDEDCVMLLMDGLLNFSERYLPNQRGGRMDAPLVMTSRVDPTEVDDEAHNVDVVSEYPLELYEASREMRHPEDVDVATAEDKLGTDHATSGFGHTHDTADIAAGPELSAYKTLGEMEDKMDAQLELARKLRAVDETDVAERVIEYHFLPDLIGNLRAFSQQEVRCLDCGEKYRRPPLSSDCRQCGGDVTLTVHEGSVTKYLETASRVAEEYGARTYTKQRIETLERSIESLFENDKNKQSGIADFM
ncbi:DNA polymerase II large subunit [Halobacteriales archaeon SW_5_70_135]|nr:MAG: DNA polymerase II large subunit [Halobacteriales archaeon SW_5_70_135]